MPPLLWMLFKIKGKLLSKGYRIHLAALPVLLQQQF